MRIGKQLREVKDMGNIIAAARGLAPGGLGKIAPPAELGVAGSPEFGNVAPGIISQMVPRMGMGMAKTTPEFGIAEAAPRAVGRGKKKKGKAIAPSSRPALGVSPKPEVQSRETARKTAMW